ncbi:hypothetical protein BAY60_07315 [Prauserella muralis]|uniref:Uncharacterized protein n=1 Tax=Prauserella muralis TaxID=588067 RepID=A0A2V4BA12_9PSEU|nr:hypothetical protein BAY60_07315 [Prauserella muralis]
MILATGCTSTVGGTPAAIGQSPAEQRTAVPDGQILLQEPGSEGPFEFGGTPAYDACLVLSMADVTEAGFTLDLGQAPQPQLVNWHQIADGRHDPAQQSSTSNSGQSTCNLPGPGGNLLGLTIHQSPFDHPDGREATERIFSRNNTVDKEILSEETIAGIRVVTTEADLGGWLVGFFGDDYYATLLADVEETGVAGRSPEQVRDALVTSVARGLAEGPTPPARYSYAEPYSWVQPPCTLFPAEDYQQSFDMPDIGRVEERYSMSEVMTTPSAQGGTQDHEPSTFVRTSCRRQNEQVANSVVGDSDVPPEDMVVEFSHYRELRGAEQDNSYDCDGDRKYDHPHGPPIKLKNVVGDGYVCFVRYGEHNPGFTFKVGRTVVEITSWNPSTYKDTQSMSAVLEQTSKDIAGRLAER